MKNPVKLLQTGLALLFFGALLGYGYYETKDIIQGPTLTVFEPRDGATVTEETVTVRGKTSNISYLSFNGKQIFTDEKGLFEQKLLVPPGYTILELKAADRFKRETKKLIRIIRKEESAS